MNMVVVTVRPDDYQVELVFDEATRGPLKRFVTDKTMPDEIKFKLGLLLFGLDDDGVGYKLADDNKFLIKLTDKTFALMRGIPE